MKAQFNTYQVDAEAMWVEPLFADVASDHILSLRLLADAEKLKWRVRVYKRHCNLRHGTSVIACGSCQRQDSGTRTSAADDDRTVDSVRGCWLG